MTAPLKGLVLDLTTRLLSPYQANPFGFNPLRERLGRIVDFPRLARESPLRLWVAALEIESGCLRLFRREEISLEVVLASAALPHLHHAVEIEGRHYWDGGYLANPPLLPLIAEGAARATLIVKLLPETAESIPRTTSDISERLAQILFAEPLRREIALVGLLRGPLQGRTLAPRLRRRLAQHRLYLIDGGERLQRAVGGNLLIPDAALIARLYEEGRAEVAAWLARPRAERRLRLQAKFTA